ncbi:MAG: choice-of-anchor D domain-containing protein [Bacteroidota bacterium]
MKKIYSFILAVMFVSMLENTLLAQQKLDPANYITGDNASNQPQGGTANTPEYFEVGPWFNGTSANAWGGNYRQTSQLGGEIIAGRSATWVINVPTGKSGTYLIYTYVLQAANNAANVYYTLQYEFSSEIQDSVRHDQRRSAITLANVGLGAWVPIMIDSLNVGNYKIKVGADSLSGSAIMRADAVRILRSSASGPDLEFGRRSRDGFDSVRVGENWLDSPLGVITYKEFPLYNLGKADLVISNVHTTFKQDRWDIKLPNNGTFPLVIPPGQKRNIIVGFRPFQEEAVNDTLVIESNDPAESLASIPLSGNGINYNFILNASVANEPHYNAPFDQLGDPRRPTIMTTGTWQPSQTGISAFPFPIAGGNLGGMYSADAVASVEYRFQLPDSVNGKPGSTGEYFIEHGAIPFTTNSENNAQVTIIPAFSTDTIRSSFNQSGLITPPFFYPLANKPIHLTQGDFNSVKIYRTVATAPVLRADLLRIRKIPTGPTLAATPQINFGNVSIYESERNKADNYRKPLEINSGGESALRIDSITISNPRYFSLQSVPLFPVELPAVNGSMTLTVLFRPDTIADNRTAILRIYSNDSTKNPYLVPLTGNGVGTGLVVEENEVQGAYTYPQNPVVFPDKANLNKWQTLTSTASSGGASLVGYIYHLEGDPSMTNKAAYVEYFPQVPTLEGRGPELDTFMVFARVPVASPNSSPRVKYTIFPGAGGQPIETIVNQLNRTSGTVFLGTTVFLRSDTRDAHGSGAITGFIRLENDTNLVNEYYKDSLVNRARQDSFLVRADAIILRESLTGVEYEVLPNIPNKYDLSQNFPNPFNPTTRIRFDLPNAENVELAVYDILGREVRKLVNDYHNAGSYTITWDGRNNFGSPVATGMYIYRLRAGSFVSTKKMLLMK